MRYVADNIHAIRMDRGISQERLAELADVAQTTVSSWECGKSLPSRPSIKRLEESLGVTYDDIVSEANGYAARSPEILLPSRKAVAAVKASPTAPVLGYIAAGEPSEMYDFHESFVVPNALKQQYPRAFYLTVRGTSMNRTMPDGCLALVDPGQREENEHDAFAVQVGSDEATVKRLRRTGNGVELVPDSLDPSHTPIAFTEEQNARSVRILGKVVWVTMPFEYRP